MTTNEETILLIDDQPANLFAIQNLLEESGRILISASSGKEGLQIALNKAIDLIILDVQMPDMDGFETAHVLKSHRKTKDIPIIFASAEKTDRKFVMRGFKGGAVDYLAKPLDPDLTKAKVSNLLQIQVQKKELIKKNLELEEADKKIKQLNGELLKNLQQLEFANKELEAFSYSVSHDLRAPLRLVLGYSRILEEDFANKIDQEGKMTLSIIQKNAQRMNSLIDDLLTFSRLGKKEIQKSEISSESLLQAVHEITQTLQNRALIKVDTLLPAFGDASLLMQVWTNLLSNAIKYSSKKENPEIKVGSRREANENVYFVNDNGTGFDMKYHDKLFKVFQRLHKLEEFEGTGVGLALVQRIISKHGGRVWAEGELNVGATFYFSLPAK